MSEKIGKDFQYAANIICAIRSVFDPDKEYYIDPEELEDPENSTLFVHAMANLAPAHVFSALTGEEKNLLEFNHVANKLCFQYMDRSGDNPSGDK